MENEEIIDAREFNPEAVYLCNLSNNPDPEYATMASSGMDVRAYITQDNVNEKFLFDADLIDDADGNKTIVIRSGGRALIPTGIYTALPLGLEIQVRTRSGLALKNGIFVLNEPGTVDGDYRGEIGVILANFGTSDFIVHSGDRIAQLVLSAYAKVLKFEKVNTVEDLPSSDRMAGGFGSTGIN